MAEAVACYASILAATVKVWKSYFKLMFSWLFRVLCVFSNKEQESCTHNFCIYAQVQRDVGFQIFLISPNFLNWKIKICL